MSFLLRRASQWADIADYPEPSTNAWERQRNLLLKPDRDMVNVAFSSARHGRSLLSVKKVDRFHRFLWLAGTSADRDVRDMRVKDEEVVSIDPMVVSFAFDVVPLQEERDLDGVDLNGVGGDGDGGNNGNGGNDGNDGNNGDGSNDNPNNNPSPQSTTNTPIKETLFPHSLREYPHTPNLTH